MKARILTAFSTAILMLLSPSAANLYFQTPQVHFSVSAETQITTDEIILDNENFTDIFGLDEIPADFSIPETVFYHGKEFTVTGIGCNAFSGNENLKALRIPQTVRIIQDNAFSECHSLESVEFSEGLTELGNNVFFCCDGIEHIKLPESLKKIGDYPFRRCRSLISIEFPESVDEIHSLLFSDCTELQNIKLPKGLTVLEMLCLSGLAKLENVMLPNGLEIIEHGAFIGCTSLKDPHLPDSVHEIGEGAFFGCTSLESITIPDGITAIHAQTFSRCTSLSKAVFPSSLKSIGSQAFMKCTSLHSVTLTENLSEFGQTPFLMSGLEEVTVMNNELDNISAVLAGADGLRTICGGSSAARNFAESNGIAFIPEDDYLKGDANCDSIVDLADVVLIMQASANPDKYSLNGSDKGHITAQGIINADVSGNDGMTTYDALVIQKYKLGLIESL